MGLKQINVVVCVWTDWKLATDGLVLEAKGLRAFQHLWLCGC